MNRIPAQYQVKTCRAKTYRARIACPLLAAVLLSGCGNLTRLSEIGRPPAMTPSGDPTSDPAYKPITLPMPRAQIVSAEANSLWRPGSRAFFKDQRAAQVGDLMTILVNITDTAALSNKSNQATTGSESAGVPNFLGLEASLPRMLSRSLDPKNLVSANSASNSTGTGTIARSETITLRLAGVITQVLPNGNLAVSARQEVRVNSELRELQVTGVVRPQDIASDNTVTHDRLAEARIAYGGRGQLADIQRPRWGQQLLDIIMPF